MSRAIGRSLDFGPAWATWFAPAACVLLLGVAYLPTLADLIGYWGGAATYQHGFLLLPVALFMLHHDRRALPSEVPRLRLPGVALLAVLAVAWALARYLGVQLFEQLALYAMLVVVLWTWWGRRCVALFAIPIAYLVLGIPIWSSLLAPLQDGTAKAATVVLQQIGVPVYREGPYLAIPAGLFEVAETCAGLRYLLSTLAVMTPFAVLNLWRPGLRLALIAVSAATSVVFNTVRVVAVIGAGHMTEMQSPILVGTGHDAFGWFIFALGLLVSMSCVAWLRRFDRPGQFNARADAERTRSERPATALRVPAYVRAGALVVALAIGPALHAVLWAAAPVGNTERFLAGARLVEGWRDRETGGQGQERSWLPRFAGAGGEITGSFSALGHDVRGYAAYYALQKQGSELVNSSNLEYEPASWQFSDGRARAESVLNGAGPSRGPTAVFETHLRAGEQDRLVWRIYWVGGESAATGLRAKALQLKSWVSRRAGSGVLLLAVDPGPRGLDVARRALARVLTETYPPLADAWQHAG